jgi:hypothetical protein
MNEYYKERADLALKDSKLLEQMSAALLDYYFAVYNGNESGKEHMDKAQSLAPRLIKEISNYL